MKLFRILLILVPALFVPGCMEVVSVEYSDRDAAMNRNAIGEAKWLPTWLPADAVNIRETHVIDTNASWLVFRLRSGALVLPENCRITARPEMPSKRVMRRFPMFARDAWSRASASNGTFYLCNEGATTHWVTHDREMDVVYSATVF
ncbi:hypothetical protein [Stenotrophomonas sp. B1-1]|uniref:hypothetical protein n=1 Tax=Stenotrophomonas sp. B1-1 TaxID=2710648 RepID=UPI0013DA949C|nr:hypothetical protein [Stenotrophomonas sp. B1-1]